MILERLWAGMVTRNFEDAGTNSRVALLVEGTQITFPRDTPQEDQERGQANLYVLDVAHDNIDSDKLSDCSMRLAILGNDMWLPEHFFAWGEASSGGVIAPLVCQTFISKALSTDPAEGTVTLPLPLQRLPAVLFGGLLLAMTTANSDDAGTNSKINLKITDQRGIPVADANVPDTSQADQERGQANIYFLPVKIPFTFSDLSERSIQLSIEGSDKWLPSNLFLFGLERIPKPGQDPIGFITIVSVREWSFGSMSTDASEGSRSVILPIH